jgi:hypothetical protein
MNGWRRIGEKTVSQAERAWCPKGERGRERSAISSPGKLTLCFRGSSAPGPIHEQQNCRYPCSPRPKRCPLGVSSIDPRSAVVNALSRPPGKYERKLKTQRNRRGLAQAVEHEVQFDDKRGTLPGFDIFTDRRWKHWLSLKRQ